VVAEAGDRRDARTPGGAATTDPDADDRRSAFDLPPVDEGKGPNGGGLVN